MVNIWSAGKKCGIHFVYAQDSMESTKEEEEEEPHPKRPKYSTPSQLIIRLTLSLSSFIYAVLNMFVYVVLFINCLLLDGRIMNSK